MYEQLEFLAPEAFPPAFSDAPQADGTKSGRTRLRVLVVDDERLIASTVAAILNQHGFEAIPAFGGEEGIERARELRPDIVLTDVLMPRVTGIELGMQLRAEFPEVRVLLFSGQAATMELLHKARAAGYDFELFPKPIHPDELVARLKSME